MIALYRHFPGLRNSLPRLSLGTLPTPVISLDGLGMRLGKRMLFCKRDDISGDCYGGNKIRKLEFLLAEAKKRGAVRVITSGAAGSNHALATALYSSRSGFRVTLMLFKQEKGPGIGRNLLADFATGAEMYHDDNYTDHLHHLEIIAGHYTDVEGIAPCVIPPGGSSPLGTVGFVNAALELKEQIDRGDLPEPAVVYVAFGTMGTAAGLLLGIRAAGMNCKVIGVRVVPSVVADEQKFRRLFVKTNALLHSLDSNFPVCSYNKHHFAIENSFFGEGYGIPTKTGLSAIELFEATEKIDLDPVYTGKCAAAFCAGAAVDSMKDRPFLYWHTKSSRFPELNNSEHDHRRLPQCFHRYFE